MYCIMASVAFSASTMSAGFMITRFGRLRRLPMPSTVACDTPTSPQTPSREMNFTLKRSTRMLCRIWL